MMVTIKVVMKTMMVAMMMISKVMTSARWTSWEKMAMLFAMEVARLMMMTPSAAEVAGKALTVQPEALRKNHMSARSACSIDGLNLNLMEMMANQQEAGESETEI